jgi:hypothetical protein
VSAAFTAAASCCRPAAKVATADTLLFCASMSHLLNVAIGGLSRDWGDYAAFANVGSGWDTDSNRWPNPESSVPL